MLYFLSHTKYEYMFYIQILIEKLKAEAKEDAERISSGWKVNGQY